MPWPKPAGSGAQLAKELRNRQAAGPSTRCDTFFLKEKSM